MDIDRRYVSYLGEGCDAQGKYRKRNTGESLRIPAMSSMHGILRRKEHVDEKVLSDAFDAGDGIRTVCS